MKIMIGVSTEQNTVNLIPCIQMGIEKLYLVETSHASLKKWSTGLINVLEKRKISVETIILQKENDHRIDLILQKLIEEFKNSADLLIWNIGGGQKPQQIAIWESFKSLKKNSEVCYSNPSTKMIEKWHYSENNLVYEEEKIRVAISAAEIMTVYGKKVEDPGLKIYEKGKTILLEEVKDLFKYPEFVKYFFACGSGQSNQEEGSENLNDFINSFRENQNLINQLSDLGEYKIKYYFQKTENQKNFALNVKNKVLGFISKTINQKRQNSKFEFINPFLVDELKKMNLPATMSLDYQLFEALLPNSNRKTPAIYFEKVLLSRTKKILENTDDYNFIQEAYANFKSASGEYDILLVTIWGTFIAFDAKTFAVDKKDSDARLYNLTQSAGRYVEWIPVFPYDSSNPVNMPLKVFDLPKSISEANKKFFVIDDESENDQVVIQNRIYKLKFFSDFLRELNLLN